MKRRTLAFPLTAGLPLALAASFVWQMAVAQDDDKLAQRFRQFDRDNNGKVTESELPQPNLFKRLDQNGDGAITLKETRAAIAAGALNGVTVPEPGEPAPSKQGRTWDFNRP